MSTEKRVSICILIKMGKKSSLLNSHKLENSLYMDILEGLFKKGISVDVDIMPILKRYVEPIQSDTDMDYVLSLHDISGVLKSLTDNNHIAVLGDYGEVLPLRFIIENNHSFLCSLTIHG